MFEYAPAPESRSIVDIAPSYGLFIDGSFDEGKATFKTVNPATEEVLAEIALAGPEGRILRLFEITGLQDRFRIHETAERAATDDDE